MARPSAVAWSLVAFLLVLSGSAEALTSQLKCSVCAAMFSELKRSIAEELPHQDVDLRHKLDPQGNRVGKTIDWHQSEVRSYELTDPLCSGIVKDYEMVLSADHGAAVRKKGAGSSKDKTVKLAGDDAKQVEVYCSGLVEEHEEEIHSILKTTSEGEELQDQWRPIMCVEIMHACSTGEMNSLQLLGINTLGVPIPGAGSGALPAMGSAGASSSSSSKKKKKKGKGGKGAKKGKGKNGKGKGKGSDSKESTKKAKKTASKKAAKKTKSKKKSKSSKTKKSRSSTEL